MCIERPMCTTFLPRLDTPPRGRGDMYTTLKRTIGFGQCGASLEAGGVSRRRTGDAGEGYRCSRPNRRSTAASQASPWVASPSRNLTTCIAARDAARGRATSARIGPQANKSTRSRLSGYYGPADMHKTIRS